LIRGGNLVAGIVPKDPLPAQSGGELKDRLDAERRNQPFLVLRDPEGRQVIRGLGEGADSVAIGRAQASGLELDDPEVSSLHAELERIGGDWVLVDDGLSRNGSFVNGERVSGRRRLRDGDALRFGQTLVVFRAPGAPAGGTVTAADTPDAASITDTQRAILVALCRPYRVGSDFATPAANRQIAEEVFLSVDAVKAHLRTLFEKFDVGDLPQNQKRVRLAELALRSGVISPRDLES
jgi:pSer/pThr/pTyr-binding forkhead associated (FHA) protein